MRHLMLFLTFVCCFQSVVVSNPMINPYGMPGITEVYIASPMEWYIELDGNWCLFDFKAQRMRLSSEYPCSTDVFVRVKSTSASQGIYRARVRFAANQLGVVSQTSLQLTAQQRAQLGYISLNQNDTVMITTDTSQQATSSSPSAKIQYWSFPLRSVPFGNSLVYSRNSNYTTGIYSTSRRSIGTTGNYTTKYKIALLDKYGTPLQYFYTPGAINAETDSTGTCIMSISIGDPDTVVHFNDRNTAHPTEEVPVTSLPVKYLDKDTLVIKQLKIPVTQYLLTVEDTHHNPVSDLLSFKEDGPSSYSQISLGFSNGSDIIPVPLRIYPSLSVCTICVASNFPYVSGCLGTWTGTYIDTPAVIKVIITIDPVVNSRAPIAVPAVNSGVTISALCENRHEVRIVISSPLPAVRGSISLYALDGKLLGTLPVRMNGPGTGTTLFRFPQGKLSPGTYLCRLTTGGCEPVSRQITVP